MAGAPTAGTAAALDVTVKNAGPSAASDVRVRLEIEDTVTITSAPSHCTRSTTPRGSQVAECRWPDLAAGEATASIVTVNVPAGVRGTFKATARVTATGRDADGTNDASTLALPVVVRTDLGLTVERPGAATTTSEPHAQTLTVRNAGPSAATSVRLDAPVPAGAKFVSASTGCTHAKGLVRCLVGELGPGESRSLTLVLQSDEPARAPAAGMARVEGAAGEIDANPADNAAPFSVPAAAGPRSSAKQSAGSGIRR